MCFHRPAIVEVFESLVAVKVRYLCLLNLLLNYSTVTAYRTVFKPTINLQCFLSPIKRIPRIMILKTNDKSMYFCSYYRH